MTNSQKRTFLAVLCGVAIAFGMASLFLVDVAPSKDYELRELQIEKTKLSIAVLKAELNEKNLTTDDLTAIYACVDRKIKNQNSEIKFPCVAVRGDSF